MRFFSNLVEGALAHPRKVLAGTLVLILVALWGFRSARLELDVYDVVDANFPSSLDLEELRRAFGDTNSAILVVRFPRPATSGEACVLLKHFEAEQRSRADLRRVLSAWSLRRPVSEGDRLWYPRALADPCERPAAEPLSVELEKVGPQPFRHLLGDDPSRLTFEVSFEEEVGADGARHFRVASLGELLASTRELAARELPGAEVDLLGPSAFRYYFKRIMARDSLASAGLLLFIIVFFRIFLGTWRAGGLYAGAVVLAMVLLYGFISLLGFPIDILTNNLFLMTTIAGTADFLFVSLAQFKTPWEDSLKKLVTPCFWTTFTTLEGFFALLTSDMAIIQRFGVAAGIGAFVEWSVVFFVLPAFLRAVGSKSGWVDPARAWRPTWFARLEGWTWSKPWAWAFVAAALAAVPAAFFLNFDDSPVRNFPKGFELRDSFDRFRAAQGWEGQVALVFEAEHQAARPDVLSSLEGDPLLAFVEDPERVKADFLGDLEGARRELAERELSMTPLFERYFAKSGQTRVPLYLRQVELSELRAFKGRVDGLCAGRCRLVGQSMVYLDYGDRVSRSLTDSLLTSLCVVLLLVFLLGRLRGHRQFLPVAISTLIGPAVMITVMAVFGLPITMMTSIFLAVIVGMTGDNAIQYYFAADQLKDGIEQRAGSSVMFGLLLVLGSAFFFLQTLTPMKLLGVLFMVGFAVNLAGDLWVLKALLPAERGSRSA